MAEKSGKAKCGEDVEKVKKDLKKSVIKLPQKRFYRQRAHSNPIADHFIDYPASPYEMDWKSLYGEYLEKEENKWKQVTYADIGCGYGGLLVALSPLFKHVLILGIEIRMKVSDYVIEKIAALRAQNPGHYLNIACIRSNAMKYLPNYFKKGQLTKMFFLYPDPHFKKSKHRWRIISHALLTEYAYVLAEKGLIYTVTDVLDLHEWILQHFESHPLFVRLTIEEYRKDPIIDSVINVTEEGQKVTRNNGTKYLAVFRRIQDPYMADANLDISN